MLFPTENVMNFYISTFRSTCAVPTLTFVCNALKSCFYYYYYYYYYICHLYTEIYNYIPGANHVPRVYDVTAIL